MGKELANLVCAWPFHVIFSEVYFKVINVLANV